MKESYQYDADGQNKVLLIETNVWNHGLLLITEHLHCDLSTLRTAPPFCNEDVKLNHTASQIGQFSFDTKARPRNVS